jgi:hypothetical protein
MPPLDLDTYTSVKQYALTLAAGGAPSNPMADNPRRNFLLFINNGLNSAAFWFDQAKNSGQGVNLGPGESWSPPGVTVPVNRVFFQSAAGTVIAIIEGYTRGNR